MRRSDLRRVPSVEVVLQALGETGLPRPSVVATVRRELAALRTRKSIPDFAHVLAEIRTRLNALWASRIQPVINGTGILIHTNFGRAPLGAEAVETITRIGANYNNLEYDLTAGARGDRAAYLEHNLALLCGAEAATVVNNNAAALVLILRHFCETAAINGERRSPIEDRRAVPLKTEVVISRGELIQIGGGFRIPDILESSGAQLREVGTTNKTSLDDYSRAISKTTALILKVHRSNFFMGGFVASPSTEEVAALAHKRGVPFVEDLGSGAVIQTEETADIEHEPTPAETLRRGIDLVCFSGDKLLGGPQSGIIAGKAKIVAALKREPFFRAFRCDKLVLATLQATVDLYLRGHGEGKLACDDRRTDAGIPVLQMLRVSNDELRSRAENIIAALSGSSIAATVGVGRAQVGGGSLPRSVIVSVTIDLAHTKHKAGVLAMRLREHSMPVIGYIARDKVKLDLRTIFPWQDAELVNAIRAASR
jgi:L-seryl-tRNA(Ser) seleniumtransferase